MKNSEKIFHQDTAANFRTAWEYSYFSIIKNKNARRRSAQHNNYGYQGTGNNEQNKNGL